MTQPFTIEGEEKARKYAEDIVWMFVPIEYTDTDSFQ